MQRLNTNLQDTIQYLQREQILHQPLFRGEQHNFENTPFQLKHENYTGVTGLRIHNGAITEDISLYTLDIDCKGIEKEGKELYKELLKRHPLLKNTYHESTKSGGYHIIFKSDLKEERARKIIFNTPFGIEVPPGEKLEIEVFCNLPVTVAPSKTPRGVYKPLNDKGIGFIPMKDLQAILDGIREKSLNYSIDNNSGNSGNFEELEEIPQNISDLLRMNEISIRKKGKYFHVDGKKGHLMQIRGNESFIYRFSTGEAMHLKDYVENYLGKEFQEPQRVGVKPDEVYKVKKYLSECEEVKKTIREDNKTLIIGPCGAGKTYTVIKELDSIEDNFIFAAPQSSMKDQITKDKDYFKDGMPVVAVGGNGYSLQKAIQSREKRIVCCFESINTNYLLKLKDKDLKRYTLVVDEVHQILNDISFRDNIDLIRKLDQFKRVIFLTATPQTVLRSTIKKVIEVKKEAKTDIEFFLIKAENKKWSPTQYKRFISKFSEFIGGESPIWLVKSSKRYFEDNIICASNRKESEDYKDFIDGTLKNKLYVTTEILNAGININNKGTFNIIVDITGANLSEVTLEQIIGRPRLADKIKVFMFDRGKSRKTVTLEEIRAIGKKHIINLDKGASLRGMMSVSKEFEHAIQLIDGKLTLDEIGLEIALHKYNTASRTSREIIEGIGHKISRELTMEDIEDELEDTTKELKPKELLNKLLDDEVKEKHFISYMIGRVIGVNMIAYISDLDNEIRYHLNNNKSFNNTISRFIKQSINSNSTFEEVKKSLYKYLGKGNKFDDVKFNDRSIVTDEIIALGEIHKSLTKALKVLSKYSLEVVDTGRVKPSKIKSICKEKLRLKFKKNKDTQKYYAVKA